MIIMLVRLWLVESVLEFELELELRPVALAHILHKLVPSLLSGRDAKRNLVEEESPGQGQNPNC